MNRSFGVRHTTKSSKTNNEMPPKYPSKCDVCGFDISVSNLWSHSTPQRLNIEKVSKTGPTTAIISHFPNIHVILIFFSLLLNLEPCFWECWGVESSSMQARWIRLAFFFNVVCRYLNREFLFVMYPWASFIEIGIASTSQLNIIRFFRYR